MKLNLNYSRRVYRGCLTILQAVEGDVKGVRK
jgi:hypothetical protein